MRDEIFPGKFAQLDTKKPYSFKDLGQDADGLQHVVAVRIRACGDFG